MPRPKDSFRIVIAVSATILAVWLGLDACGNLAWFWGTGTRSQFYRDIVVGGTTLILGIPIGLWLAETPRRADEKNRLRELADRRKNLLTHIAEDMNRNMTYAARVIEYLDTRQLLPTFRLEVAGLEFTVHLWHEYALDTELRRKLAQMLFELRHLNERLDLLSRVTCLAPSGDEDPDEVSRRVALWDRLRASWSVQDELETLVKNVVRPELPSHRRMRSLEIAAGTIGLATSVRRDAAELLELLPDNLVDEAVNGSDAS